MFDYPFINSKIMNKIKNKDIEKCVIIELRTNNHKTYIENTNKFIDYCNKKEEKLLYGEITDEDTEKDLITTNYKKKIFKI